MIRIARLGEWIDSPHWRAFVREIAAGLSERGLEQWAAARGLDISSRLLATGYEMARGGLRTGRLLGELELGDTLPRSLWQRNREIPSAYQVVVEMRRYDADVGEEVVHYHTIDFAHNPTGRDILREARVEIERRMLMGYYPYADTDLSDWWVAVQTGFRRSAL